MAATSTIFLLLYEVSTQGITYQLGFSGEADKQEFLDGCMAQSVIDTEIVPTVHDRILTLSTCTGNGHATRWVVQAVLRCEAPAEPRPEETLPADSQSAQTAPAETAPEETIPEGNTESTTAADSAPQEADEQQVPESAAPEEAEPQTAEEPADPETQPQEDLQEEPVTSSQEASEPEIPQEETETPCVPSQDGRGATVRRGRLVQRIPQERFTEAGRGNARSNISVKGGMT